MSLGGRESQVGRSEGATIRAPAYCLQCGLIFPSPVRATEWVYLESCLTNCPRCGATASIVNGVLAIIDGIVELVTSDDISRAVFKEMRAATAEIRRFGQEAVLQELEQTRPKAGGFLRRCYEAVNASPVICSVVVGAFLLAAEKTYDAISAGTNQPYELIAAEMVARMMREPQIDMRNLTFPDPIKGRTDPVIAHFPDLSLGHVVKGHDQQHAEHKNRKARRADSAKGRKGGADR